ncbi:MAG: hypothetical protein GY853_13350 [PVC group bacterium]|nr:hypothetical protein [PVC group bacterium]
MADTTITVAFMTEVSEVVESEMTFAAGLITFDSGDYPNGGIAFLEIYRQFTTVYAVFFTDESETTSETANRRIWWDSDNDKIKVYTYHTADSTKGFTEARTVASGKRMDLAYPSGVKFLAVGWRN